MGRRKAFPRFLDARASNISLLVLIKYRPCAFCLHTLAYAKIPGKAGREPGMHEECALVKKRWDDFVIAAQAFKDSGRTLRPEAAANVRGATWEAANALAFDRDPFGRFKIDGRELEPPRRDARGRFLRGRLL